jgi:hypothetical protein
MIYQQLPPPPPPCTIACIHNEYKVFLPAIQKPSDIVCDRNNICDNLYTDKNGYHYVTDDGIYNEIWLSELITINGKIHIRIESNNGSELPQTNLGYILIYIFTEDQYFWTTYQIVENGL